MNRSILYKLLPKIYRLYTGNSVYSYKFNKLGKNSFIHKSVMIPISNGISIENSVTVQKDAWLNLIDISMSKLKLSEGVNIGMRSTISVVNSIVLEKNVLIGINVYIADHEHNYENINLPIMFQGIKSSEGVKIGEGTWIGNNAIILSSNKIEIGKNCVIGANSVVKESVPDYSVVAGIPATIIKTYDKKNKKWINMSKKS